MSVVTLHKTPPQHDVVAGLRNLADKIERGEELDIVTTCVVMLGHTSDRLLENGDMERGSDYSLYSLGPRSDAFTVRGLMSTMLNFHMNG